MHTVTSADGTAIAYEQIGAGTAGTVILVGGALEDRRSPKLTDLAAALAALDLTVLVYDRRGRGDSGDTPSVYQAGHEIDDLAALVAAASGAAALFGWSAGAVLALRAAASGRIPGLTRVVAFEPPFVVDRTGHVPPQDAGTRLEQLLAEGKTGKAAAYYLRKVMGVPWTMVTTMRLTPYWRTMKNLATSTAHDWAVIGPYTRGEALRPADWAELTVPVLVLAGTDSAASVKTAAAATAAALPLAHHRELPRLGHNQNVELIAAPTADFLTGKGAI
ncbi:alpha/beta hydrolase [Nocardia farcinica]|uniref:alpha/beta hydrolase n=1 Tax=Nocardia farcinica TaxID=37329 RepID=UPI0018958AAF|nr:alpha/beta hydrolase [Nocardia farcinica]MBF6264726.1 alpha/beta hydrolase [Nocardia farcinica]MBF6283512.1 alpha/beta hydrolase [Nocardia farcinica]MBF6307294.1 alpha/beta hydrolase [Nocardia farcinica]MBF6392152.1 alpha/beta hydrolase [Nocardia farcinica]MBF6492360.1 alpha/beta hydrolase [Nocardia farcinica]